MWDDAVQDVLAAEDGLVPLEPDAPTRVRLQLSGEARRGSRRQERGEEARLPPSPGGLVAEAGRASGPAGRPGHREVLEDGGRAGAERSRGPPSPWDVQGEAVPECCGPDCGAEAH